MYIIDGHNLLHAVHKIEGDFQEAAFRRYDQAAYEAAGGVDLCRFVGIFMKATGQTGEIIFDGTGPRDTSIYDNVAGLEVSFAGIGTDADTVIEDKIKANTAPKRLIIVSSDRRLRKAARARKSTSIKSEEFWILINKQLSKKRPKPEPPAKRRGLTDSETKQWLDFFGLEK